MDIFTLQSAQAYTDNLLGADTEGSSLIINNVSDTQIHIKDSRKYDLQSLTVHGNSTQDSTPSKDNPVEIVSVGDSGSVDIKVCKKNLLDASNLKKCQRVASSGGSIFQYMGGAFEYPYLPDQECKGVGGFVKCKAGITYTFSVTNPNAYYSLNLAEYKSEEDARNVKNGVGMSVNKGTITYTANYDGVLLCGIASVYTNGTSNTHKCTESELMQVEIGNIATEYEPYQGTMVTIPLSEPLRGINSYYDQICQQDGKWGIVRKITRENLSEVMLKTNTLHVTSLVRWSNILYGISKGNAMCEYFPATTNVYVEEQRQTDFLDLSGYVEGGALFLNIVGFTTVDEYHAWLKEHTDITYIRPLVTARFEILPDDIQSQLNALQTYYGITNITADGATVDASYMADTKLYIDKRITELANAIVATAE